MSSATRGVKVTVTLTKREATAILRSEGFTNGHGVKQSNDLRAAQMKVIGAIAAATPPPGLTP